MRNAPRAPMTTTCQVQSERHFAAIALSAPSNASAQAVSWWYAASVENRKINPSRMIRTTRIAETSDAVIHSCTLGASRSATNGSAISGRRLKYTTLRKRGTAALSFQSTTSVRTLTANDIALSTMPSAGILSPSLKVLFRRLMTILAMPRRKRFWNPLCSSGALGSSRRGMTGSAGEGAAVLSAGAGAVMGAGAGLGVGLFSIMAGLLSFFWALRYKVSCVSLFLSKRCGRLRLGFLAGYIVH